MKGHIVSSQEAEEYAWKELVEHGCRICGKMCRNNRGLREHKRSEHGTKVSSTGGFSPGARPTRDDHKTSRV